MKQRTGILPHTGLIAAASLLAGGAELVPVDEKAPPASRDGGCKYCGREFQTAAGYASHLRRYHGET